MLVILSKSDELIWLFLFRMVEMFNCGQSWYVDLCVCFVLGCQPNVLVFIQMTTFIIILLLKASITLLRWIFKILIRVKRAVDPLDGKWSWPWISTAAPKELPMRYPWHIGPPPIFHTGTQQRCYALEVLSIYYMSNCWAQSVGTEFLFIVCGSSPQDNSLFQFLRVLWKQNYV